MFNSTNNISEQTLGLTNEHIHFFNNDTSSSSKKQTLNPLGVHNEMLADYTLLVNKASEAGIEIKIASGYRSFERQLLIWNNKFTGKTPIKNNDGDVINIQELSDLQIIEAILLFSALPGASRHHWGSDIDIYSPNLLNGQPLQLESWEYNSNGPMAKLSDWLTKNAKDFGFYFPYDRYRGGIAAEPWHLSYRPLATQYQSSLSLQLLHGLISQTDIAGKDVIIDNLTKIYEQFIVNINLDS